MSISVGGINIPESLIMCEWRIGVLERLLDRTLPFLPPGAITPQMVEQIREEVFTQLQKKYPDAGLSRNAPNG
jgi:hypothetical protein